VWVIACEDSKSAPDYFRTLLSPFRSRVTPKFPRCPSDPLSVVEAVVGMTGEELARPASDRFWAVVDAEPHAPPARHTRLADAARRAVDAGVTLLVANPCIEHWFHLHLEDADGTHHAASDATRAFSDACTSRRLPDYRKGGTDFGRFVTLEAAGEAARRAEKRHRLKASADPLPLPHECQPCCTNCYEFIDALQKLIDSPS